MFSAVTICEKWFGNVCVKANTTVSVNWSKGATHATLHPCEGVSIRVPWAMCPTFLRSEFKSAEPKPKAKSKAKSKAKAKNVEAEAERWSDRMEMAMELAEEGLSVEEMEYTLNEAGLGGF